MRLASRQDFEGGLYTLYRRYPFFAERAATIAARYPVSVGKVLVVGCGYGYLVEELLNRGYDAWGIDAAAYAVNKSQSELSNTARLRIGRLDATNAADMDAAIQKAGLTGQAKFGLAVTEDILPACAGDAEVATLLTQCRRVANALFHIVSPGDPADPAKLSGVLWKSIAAWKALVGTDPVMDAETGRVS